MLTREELHFIKSDLREHVCAPEACRDCEHRLKLADKIAAMCGCDFCSPRAG